MSCSKSSVPPPHHLLPEASVTVRGHGSPQDSWGAGASPFAEPVGLDTVRAGGCELVGSGSSGPCGEQARPSLVVLLLTLGGLQGGKCHCGVVGRSPTTARGLGQTSEGPPCLPKIGEESEKVSQATGTRHGIAWGQEYHTSGTCSRMDCQIERGRWE